MNISAKLSVVMVLALVVSGAAHAAGTGWSPECLTISKANDLILTQQQQPDNDSAQPGEHEDHDNVPGCRYRGGEDLQLLV